MPSLLRCGELLQNCPVQLVLAGEGYELGRGAEFQQLLLLAGDEGGGDVLVLGADYDG